MNITVKVDDITLETIIEQAVTGWDSDDEEYERKRPVTIASLVAAEIVDRLAADQDRWGSLKEKVAKVRAEAIREKVLPAIEEAIHGPVRKTNSYGEPVGTETTTLRELIAAEARKALTAPVDQYSRSGQTVVGKVVAEEVQKAFAAEVKSAVQQARQQVADEIGSQVATAVASAMKGR